MSEKIIVIGMSTSDRDIESWSFDDEVSCQKFCEMLVRENGKKVWVIKGQIIGRYQPVPYPVEFVKENKPSQAS